MPAPARILVSGAGIAGTVFAHWASRAGFKVTVVEKAPAMRTTGQNIDINSPAARTIVAKMGAMEAFLAAGTGEKGVLIIDEKMRPWAKLDAGPHFSLTANPEIIRGALAQVFYETAQQGPEYIFDEVVTSIEEGKDRIRVEFSKASAQEFDLVVAADSLYSNVRRLALKDDHACVHWLGVYAAFFSYKNAGGKIGEDMWARWFHAKQRRQIVLRPSKLGLTHCTVTVMPKDTALVGSHRLPIAQQKELFAKYFEGLEGIAPEAIREMLAADDFYLSPVSQVKPERYSKGRVAFIGDAGMCPTFYTGMGTPLAVISAYVLAGELLRSTRQGRVDVPAALDGYESIMRPYVTNLQKLPPGLPGIFTPESWGVHVLRFIFAFVKRSGLGKLIRHEEKDQKLSLPDYQFPRSQVSPAAKQA